MMNVLLFFAAVPLVLLGIVLTGTGLVTLLNGLLFVLINIRKVILGVGALSGWLAGLLFVPGGLFILFLKDKEITQGFMKLELSLIVTAIVSMILNYDVVFASDEKDTPKKESE